MKSLPPTKPEELPNSFIGQGDDLLVAPDSQRFSPNGMNGFSTAPNAALAKVDAKAGVSQGGFIETGERNGFERSELDRPEFMKKPHNAELPFTKAVIPMTMEDRVEGVQVHRRLYNVWFLGVFCK